MTWDAQGQLCSVSVGCPGRSTWSSHSWLSGARGGRNRYCAGPGDGFEILGRPRRLTYPVKGRRAGALGERCRQGKGGRLCEGACSPARKRVKHPAFMINVNTPSSACATVTSKCACCSQPAIRWHQASITGLLCSALTPGVRPQGRGMASTQLNSPLGRRGCQASHGLASRQSDDTSYRIEVGNEPS